MTTVKYERDIYPKGFIATLPSLLIGWSCRNLILLQHDSARFKTLPELEFTKDSPHIGHKMYVNDGGVHCEKSRLSISRGQLQNNIVQGTPRRRVSFLSDLNSRETSHSSPVRASFGVFFVVSLGENDCDISRHSRWFSRVQIHYLFIHAVSKAHIWQSLVDKLLSKLSHHTWPTGAVALVLV